MENQKETLAWFEFIIAGSGAEFDAALKDKKKIRSININKITKNYSVGQ